MQELAQFCELFVAAAYTPSSHYMQDLHVICLINRSSVTDWGDHNFQENNPYDAIDNLILLSRRMQLLLHKVSIIAIWINLKNPSVKASASYLSGTTVKTWKNLSNRSGLRSFKSRHIWYAF